MADKGSAGTQKLEEKEGKTLLVEKDILKKIEEVLGLEEGGGEGESVDVERIAKRNYDRFAAWKATDGGEEK